MDEKEITRIKVGKFDISIIGLKQVMAEMAGSHADRTDAEIATAMLERLGVDNYIPGGARDEYAPAFVREFRKFMGQPCAETVSNELEIKVLGMGCGQCNSLEQTIMELLTELQLPANLEHVSDIKEIAKYGVMGTPGLVINGKVMAAGKVPPKGKIKQWLLESAEGLSKSK
jgi:small redox-active disulfide protein 2